MMFSDKSHKTFGKTDESYAQGALVDYALYGFGAGEFIASVPQLRHKQGELLGKGRLLEVVAVAELPCGYVKHLVELRKEFVNAFLLVFHHHAFYGQTHDVDGGETEVASSYGGLFTVAVFKHSCAAPHRGHLVFVAFGVVRRPFLVVVEGGVEIHEVREETACSDFAGQLVKVVIAVFG